MTNIELKPCPFCGTKPRFKLTSTIFSNYTKAVEFKIGCEKCGYEFEKLHRFEIQFDLESDSGIKIVEDSRIECAEAWNRRADNG